MEFDAGVVALEMQRADFDDPAGVWEQLATHGFCTMCPDVTRWACAQLVEDTRSFNVLGRRRPVSIKNMVRALVPGKQAMLAEHHDAGADAHMDWLVLKALHDQAGRARGADATHDQQASG